MSGIELVDAQHVCTQQGPSLADNAQGANVQQSSTGCTRASDLLQVTSIYYDKQNS